MRQPTQRFWDALIIREWYRFGKCNDLKRYCIAEFGCFPHELKLHRTENCFGGVRSWVATYMPHFSQKLLATKKEDAVQLLDWLAKVKVRCEINPAARRYHAEMRYQSVKSKLLMHQSMKSSLLEQLLNPMNQPNIVKPTSVRKYNRTRR